MHILIRLALCFTLIASLLSGCVVAPQPNPAVVYPPPPNYALEQIRRCRSDNQRAHAEALDAYERARRSGLIDRSEAQNFNAMEVRLRNLSVELGRDGLTLQDCQRIGGAIARERNEVARMSRSDPGAVSRCVADNRHAHDETYRIYNNAMRAGRISAGEAQRFQANDKRLINYQAELKRDGLSLAECHRIGGAIAKERAIVEEMVR